MGLKSPGLRCPSTFHKLPEGTLENLTEEQKLAIVSRHFVTGVTVLTADISNYHSTSVETFGGEKITLFRRRDMVFISYMEDHYPVVTPDVIASNGVIHVIDKVILPPVTTTVAPPPTPTLPPPPTPTTVAPPPTPILPGLNLCIPTLSESGGRLAKPIAQVKDYYIDEESTFLKKCLRWR